MTRQVHCPVGNQQKVVVAKALAQKNMKIVYHG